VCIYTRICICTHTRIYTDITHNAAQAENDAKTRACRYVYIYASICIHICTTHIQTHICILHIYTHTCVNVYMYVCIYMCSIHMCVYIHVCGTCAHTRIHIQTYGHNAAQIVKAAKTLASTYVYIYICVYKCM